MRSTFQMLVFIAYVAALGWGGWYVFSGRMIADRETATPGVSLALPQTGGPAPSDPVGNVPRDTYSENVDPTPEEPNPDGSDDAGNDKDSVPSSPEAP